MTFDLQTNIAKTAQDVRKAQTSLAESEAAIAANKVEIEELVAELKDVEGVRFSLFASRDKALHDLQTAGQRYAFYCNEAIAQPL